MALSRRTGQRFQGSIWPGFVDAVTGLLMVLVFVLTIFMVMQYVLRETISGQDKRLDAQSGEIAALAQALGLEQRRSADLAARVGELDATLADARTEALAQEALIARLRGDLSARDSDLAAAQTRITGFEAQVAALLSERDTALGQVSALEAEQARLFSEQEALNLALAQARSEIDAGVEAARLAAARREALEALVADLRRQNSEAADAATALGARVDALQTQLSEEEATRLAEAAAAEALRKRLEGADAELTAMTLALEEQRQRAEDTLTLLAAAEAAESDLTARLAAALLDAETGETALATAQAEITDLRARVAALESVQSATGADLDAARAALERALADRLAAETRAQAEQTAARDTETALRDQLAAALAAKLAAEQQNSDALTEAEVRAALLAQANRELQDANAQSAEAQRAQALLNQQVAALRSQLGQLQALLDDYKARDEAAQVQITSLGSDLNTALARVAAEERRRRQLEEAERARLEAEKQDLEKYRSEFFGKLRDILGTQEGVQISGDRFVFSSEVLFPPGAAELSSEGQREIAKVAAILRNVADDIPEGIDWVIRVDGHTDNVPLSGTGEFRDNWELSQARALSVVRYMVDFLGIPPDRLAANGFGQYQPVNPADTPSARAQNRRIELKLTEK